MAIWEAKRQCPQIILVVGDNHKYTYTSTRIFHMMLDYTPLVEVFSIDEAFLDVTRSLKIFGTPEYCVSAEGPDQAEFRPDLLCRHRSK